MTTYQALVDASAKARAEFFEKRQRCWECIASIMAGLKDYNGVPDDQIVYLKWNGQSGMSRQYSGLPPGEGEYLVPTAAEYDREDGCWHLGVRICLTPKTHFPKQYVTFVLCVTEQNGTPYVKVGINEKLKPVNHHNEASLKQFCDGLANESLQAIAKGDTPTVSKAIGFEVTGVGQV